MKRLLIATLAVCVAGLFFSQVTTAEDDKNPLEGLKCFLMPKKDIKEDKFVEYKDGKVYFCCPGCVKKYSKAPEEYATKANHQLVLSGQYVQSVCPMSGGDLDDKTAIEVQGVEVKFCCDKCKGAAEKLEGDEQLEALFGEEAFVKAEYKLVEEEEDDK